MRSTDQAETEASVRVPRIEDLLGQMTLLEKVAMLSGRDIWCTVPIPRLGIPSLVMTDGPHGVRASNPETGRPVGPTTCFPTGVSMAASWNPELIQRVGQALGEETLAMGCDILLGPCVNIVRGPLAGRNFEAYSEDPYLAGRIGVAFVKGVQSRGAGTSLKHFAANNYEIERFRASSDVDERTLREIYLPAFEAVTKETQPWTVMCSYNRINGVYASQNHHLLRDILKDEWGFLGFVVSDWGANHTTLESVEGGLDLEMPGPAKYYGQLLVEVVRNWQLDEKWVDDAVRRILRIIVRAGKLDGPAEPPMGSVNTPEHQALARELAEEAITLLKNDGQALPLDAGKIRSIAVIGPNAAEARIGGGGSSYVAPPHRVSPLDALRARVGDRVHIEYALGCDNYVEPPAVREEWLALPDGSGQGLTVEFFNNPNFAGAPDAVTTARQPEHFFFASPPFPGISPEHFSLRDTARLSVPESGLYAFSLTNTSACRVYLDGELLLENESPLEAGYETAQTSVSVGRSLEAGRPYPVRIEYVKDNQMPFGGCRLALAFAPAPEDDHRLEQAVELARRSDVALIFAGMPEHYETEGWDRPHMDLPGRQNELIAAVVEANPNTVVVLNTGSPVTMPWIHEVPAILEAYYPGQEAGDAVARVLLGQVNPSGKLPETFPFQLRDNPSYINSTYPGARHVHYGEGIFVGYRYYDEQGTEPLFPFGFGLSYTTFEYGPLQAPAQFKSGEPVEVSLTVKNTGDVAGKEVVQLYVQDKQSSLRRPPKELKGFAKVALGPGESQAVRFTLDERALSFYDPQEGRWVAEPGEFVILAGSSSRDIRAQATFMLQGEKRGGSVQ